MHPAAPEGAAEITDKERYEQIRHLLGDAVADPTGGLHVHVGMPDAETAIKAFNALRRHLPLLQALGANSPFRHGRDTGLASAREVTMRGWPRSGVPRAMRDFEDFCTSSALLSRAADVEDYTWFWWKLRPHPRLGTVEIRALDAQTSLDDLAALVALTHCLARHAATAPAEPDPPAELLDEGAFRAARFGVDAELPDADGRRRPVARRCSTRSSPTVAPHARELGCEDELDGVRRLVERGGGAGAAARRPRDRRPRRDAARRTVRPRETCRDATPASPARARRSARAPIPLSGQRRSRGIGALRDPSHRQAPRARGRCFLRPLACRPVAPVPTPLSKRWPWLVLGLASGSPRCRCSPAAPAREQRRRRAEAQATLFATELRDAVREITVFGNAVPERELATALRPVIDATARDRRRVGWTACGRRARRRRPRSTGCAPSSTRSALPPPPTRTRPLYGAS